jgi:hypothetical protein
VTAPFFFGRPPVPYSWFKWFLQERLALHPVMTNHRYRRVHLAHSKPLATVLYIGPKEKKSWAFVELLTEEALPPVEVAEATRM